MNNNDKYLIIDKDKVTSNIEGFDFSYDYIAKGGPRSSTYLQTISVKYISPTGQVMTRNFQKGERRQSGLVLARLAIQVFEDKLADLSTEELKSLETDGTGNIIGFWASKDDLFERWGNGANAGKLPAVKYVADNFLGNAYPSNSNAKYYFYNSGLYDSISMAMNLLKKFGDNGAQFQMVVSQGDFAPSVDNSSPSSTPRRTKNNYSRNYASKVITSSNVIFRGAPGTGKSFLAKQIAAEIVSDGRVSEESDLTEEERNRIEFVQFHPSYDYTDFVEGLRPVNDENSGIAFKLEDGVFKKFCKRAADDIGVDLELEGFAQYLKSLGNNEYSNYLPIIEQLLGIKQYNGSKIQEFPVFKSMSELVINQKSIKDIDNKHDFRQWLITPINYVLKYYELQLMERYNLGLNTERNYVFIIDEINRAEISKVFGELFFSLDPGYRGKSGSVKTQYSNLHDAGERDFFIPKNVYIIGTMNDIDRSLDSFDFAMRRRFRFIKISAEESIQMFNNVLDENGELLLSESMIEEIVNRMSKLNQLISSDDFPELNDNYHIGASYFLKLPELNYNFDDLWDDYLEPLIDDYLKGTYSSQEKIDSLKFAYRNSSEYDYENNR